MEYQEFEEIAKEFKTDEKKRGDLSNERWIYFGDKVGFFFLDLTKNSLTDKVTFFFLDLTKKSSVFQSIFR